MGKREKEKNVKETKKYTNIKINQEKNTDDKSGLLTRLKKIKDNIISFVRTKYREFRHKFKYNKKYGIVKNFLKVLILMIGLYLVLYPIIPGLIYKLFYEGKEVYPYKTKLGSVEEQDSDDNNLNYPEEDRLVIPSLNINMPIVQGNDDEVLDLGVWHRPGTGVPGEGNMVLTGHRIGYAFLPNEIRNSTSFYNLDKLKVGEYVIIYWGGEEYDYEVTGQEVVDKTATYIEEQKDEEKLTLYTCHPLGQNSKRLVYYAKRLEI